MRLPQEVGYEYLKETHLKERYRSYLYETCSTYYIYPSVWLDFEYRQENVIVFTS